MPLPPAPQNPLAIVEALLAAGFGASDIAVAIAAVFPVSATDLGACLLDPAAFPGTTRDRMGTLLGSISRFTPSDVTAALDALFPPGPPLIKITALTATAQGGPAGMRFWALDASGSLWTTSQQTPGGAWGSWQGHGFGNQPTAFTAIAAALQNTGAAMLGALDQNGQLWCIRQTGPGQGWGNWEGPGVVKQPHGFTMLAASQQGGNRGIEFWAMNADGQVWTLYQLTAGGPWSNWEGAGFKGQPLPLKRIAAAQQNNGNVLFCGLDSNGVVHTISQGWPGGDWNGWAVPGPFQAPPPAFVEIAAVEQGGGLGVQLIGLAADGTVWTIHQTSRGGPWSPGWESIRPGQPATMSLIAAAQQGNGDVGLWTLAGSGELWFIGQLQPGVDTWGTWSQPPMPS